MRKEEKLDSLNELLERLKAERRRVVMMMAHGDGEKPSLGIPPPAGGYPGRVYGR